MLKQLQVILSALAVFLLAGLCRSETVTGEELELVAEFSVEREGSVLPKFFEVPKLDPMYGVDGHPARTPEFVVISMPVVAYGSFTLSNDSGEVGERALAYSLSGYEVWRPDERVEWMRQNGSPFSPGASAFDHHRPDAAVFTYAHGPWNGYGSATGTPLGPESIKTLSPGEVEVDEKTGHGFGFYVIDDPEALRAMTLGPDDVDGASQLWAYQRITSYETSMIQGPFIHYIPIDFEGGTYAEGELPAAIEIRAKWRNQSMMQEIESNHCVTKSGMPDGGVTEGRGIHIEWQKGPLVANETEGKALELKPNGAFVEGVIQAAISRIEHYQDVAEGAFRCRENAIAITKLQEALQWLGWRASRREREGVLGTHST